MLVRRSPWQAWEKWSLYPITSWNDGGAPLKLIPLLWKAKSKQSTASVVGWVDTPKVPRHRKFRQCHRPHLRFVKNWSSTICYSLPCCWCLQTRLGILGWFCCFRDTLEAARRWLSYGFPLFWYVSTLIALIERSVLRLTNSSVITQGQSLMMSLKASLCQTLDQIQFLLILTG